LCLALSALVAASDDAPPLTLNLAFGDPTEAPPADPITSGATVGLNVTVLLIGDGALTSDPVVEVSLRRWDKPEACVTEVALIPAALPEEKRAHTVAFALDTAGLSGGSYEVVATIEYSGIEITTTDNRRILGTLILLDPKPELHPVELSIDPAVPLQWGETATVHATIANTGRLAAGAFRVVFEICGSAGGDCVAWSDTPFASRLIAGLARNDEIRVSVPLDLVDLFGTTVIEGSFPLRVRIVYPTVEGTVPTGEAAELDPDNNEMRTSVLIGSSKLGLPDLVPITLTFDENLPLHWDNAMVAIATIANLGGSATGAGGFDVQFSYRQVGASDWTAFDVERVSESLGIDVSYNQTNRRTADTTIGSLSPGTYELKMEVDSGDAVTERNESNNTLIVGFSVRGIELQAQGIELPSAEILQGDSLIVRTSVVNTGDLPATDFSIGFYLDGERFDTFFYVNADGLREYESMQAQGVLDTHDVPSGDYDLRVIVDPDDRIPEFDEGNNTAIMPIYIGKPNQRKAELHITDLRLDPPSPIAAGWDVECSLELRNAGEIAAEPFLLTLAIRPCGLSCDDSASEWVAAVDAAGGPVDLLIPGLERGEARWITLTFSTPELPPGVYGLRATADADDSILEMDESNNAVEIAFRLGESQISPLPTGDHANLTIQGLAVEPAAPCEESIVELRGIVVNNGVEATGEFLVSYRWIDPYGNQYELGTEQMPGLAASSSQSFARTYDTTSFPAGVHQAFVIVDPDGRIPERDETDNHGRVEVSVCGGDVPVRPDLVVSAVRFESPDAPLAEGNAVEKGQRLYAYVTVRNAGNVPSGPFSVSFETSLGAEIESWTSVGPLDQVEVSHPLPTSVAGEFAVTVRVDPDQLIPEGNETDNTIPNAYVTELPSYVVLPPDVPSPEAVIGPSNAGAVRWLQADSSSDVIYVVTTTGTIQRIDTDDAAVRPIVLLEEAVTAVAWSLSSVQHAYVGTSSGIVYAIDLDAGSVIAQASMGGPVVALTQGGTGQVFVAMPGGFHQLTLAGSELVVSRGIEIEGDMLDILYDADRSTVYLLSTEGVFAYGDALQRLCVLDAADLVGTPAVLSLAGSGIYVGTRAGSGGVVYALSHCTVSGGEDGRMLIGWRYPRMGTLPGQVLSIVIDPRDIDPIYVATDAGMLYSLGFDGQPLWSYEAGRSIGSTPLADKRSGRIFFGDDGGIPHVLTLDGAPAFEIQLGGFGGSIRSTLAIVETRERTDLGTRFVRNYYYGTEAGAVYRIASQQ
jgi:hypothetical protein